MKKIIIAICATAAFILISAFLLGSFIFGNYIYYYTQIDNSKYVNTLKNNDTYYTYTLPSYSTDGEPAELSFDTLRELRADAFLKVKVSRAAGVLDWEEVKLGDIPEAIRNFFTQNNR